MRRNERTEHVREGQVDVATADPGPQGLVAGETGDDIGRQAREVSECDSEPGLDR